MLSTNPHQAIYKQHHVYLWGRYSVFCITVLIPSHPDQNIYWSAQWHLVLLSEGNRGRRGLGFSSQCEKRTWSRCTHKAYGVHQGMHLLCSMFFGTWFCSQLSEFSAYFALNSHWIKFRNNPAFLIHQSTTKLQCCLISYITSILIFLCSCSCTVSQIQPAVWKEPCLLLCLLVSVCDMIL